MIWKLILSLMTFIFLSIEKQAVKINTIHSSMGAAASSDLTLFLSGDVMTGRGIDQVLPQSVDPRIYEAYVQNASAYVQLAEREHGTIDQPVSYAYLWGDALDVWEQFAPALKIINLETSITNHDDPWPEKGIHYRMHPRNVPVLTVADIDFCSLANNHTLDWGRAGLRETLLTLEEAGVASAGAGQDLAEAREPALLETGKGRVIILAYGYETSGIPHSWAATPQRSGVNLLPNLSEKTVNMIGQQVKAVKQPGDIVVFSVHWGSNGGYDIPPRQRDFARQLIDSAGVDIIHGHSSHHPQGMEVYQDKLILYGAGDFLNDYEGISGHEQYRGDLSLMYFPRLDAASGQLVSMKMVPMQIRNFQLHRASSSDARWLRRVLDREGKKLGTSVTLEEDGTLALQW